MGGAIQKAKSRASSWLIHIVIISGLITTNLRQTDVRV